MLWQDNERHTAMAAWKLLRPTNLSSRRTKNLKTLARLYTSSGMSTVVTTQRLMAFARLIMASTFGALQRRNIGGEAEKKQMLSV